MIPKVIHYCWFGGNVKPASVERNIASWRRACPDYEIREWNESNADVKGNTYCKEAYEAKKWAFVSDYVRVKALYSCGGIYLDTDVEVVRSFEPLLENKAFMGFENDRMIATSTIGAERKAEFLGEMLQYYAENHFMHEDGSLNTMTNVQLLTTLLIKGHGLKANGKEQVLGSGMHILPMESLVAKDYWTGWILADESTYTVHHYASTWVDEGERERIAMERRYIRQIYKKIEIPVHKIAAAKATFELEGLRGVLKKLS